MAGEFDEPEYGIRKGLKTEWLGKPRLKVKTKREKKGKKEDHGYEGLEGKERPERFSWFKRSARLTST